MIAGIYAVLLKEGKPWLRDELTFHASYEEAVEYAETQGKYLQTRALVYRIAAGDPVWTWAPPSVDAPLAAGGVPRENAGGGSEKT